MKNDICQFHPEALSCRDELVNVSVSIDHKRFHVLHLGNLLQNEHSKFVEHDIILTLNEHMCVTTHIVIRMILFVVEHAT